MKRQSEFMHWAKTRPRVKYDLALSGILNLPFPELDVKLNELELHGDNAYGYRPLVEALAAHCHVPPEMSSQFPVARRWQTTLRWQRCSSTATKF